MTHERVSRLYGIELNQGFVNNFYKSIEILDDERVRLKNKLGDDIIVSKKYVFPLTVSSTLTFPNPKPEKVILVPHFDTRRLFGLLAGESIS